MAFATRETIASFDFIIFYNVYYIKKFLVHNLYVECSALLVLYCINFDSFPFVCA